MGGIFVEIDCGGEVLWHGAAVEILAPRELKIATEKTPCSALAKYNA